MEKNAPANGRHVVRIEDENVIDIPGEEGRQIGQTYYYGLYFTGDDVAQAWAMEAFERSRDGGSQRGITINRYSDGSTTIMAFEGGKLAAQGAADIDFDGTWRFIDGSGRFDGISGGGTYVGEAFQGIAYSNVSGSVE